ncbi:hypothetical protein KDH_48690 [Dictyobacter sp. S3.2.2.5]|uniref:Alpha-L-rhamnosidase six-hairpin glycosidase domain-containing protein n=1 Tax=Dictyobacter halimunensis TaxID=3026934 RepID=A0ABQ6FWL5_9CHLR|nr:hypothetical protein KDH_48690 [Dictyobacter sp. S3.2.2.5]
MTDVVRDSRAVQWPATSFRSGDRALDSAFRIAVGDIAGNIVPFKDGLLEQPELSLLAGLDYNTPWTRDTAINTWNGAGLLFPLVTYNTLLSVLKREGDEVQIGGQYWDAISWTLGAWHQYLWTGDKEFLALAFEAVSNSLAYFESSEFDPRYNLFRGPACYGDGIAAYDDFYARTRGSSGILAWVKNNPDQASTPGFGIPMHALSTNCLYYAAYRLLSPMAGELQRPVDPAWEQKAASLKEAIQIHFWNAESGSYRYYVDEFEKCEHQEGMGHAFVLLFGIADPEQAASVLNQQYLTEHGIPCVWPQFERYRDAEGMRFGRHCGVVWPHIQAFWAQAAAEQGRLDLFEHELRNVAGKACRDSQFAEIYHPITGAIYGGVQEGPRGKVIGEQISEWRSCSRQTWSASGYLRMIFMGLLGMRFSVEGVSFQPLLPSGLDGVELHDLPYRSMLLDIQIQGTGTTIQEFLLNGEPMSSPSVLATATGRQQITIRLS